MWMGLRNVGLFSHIEVQSVSDLGVYKSRK